MYIVNDEKISSAKRMFDKYEEKRNELLKNEIFKDYNYRINNAKYNYLTSKIDNYIKKLNFYIGIE